MKLRYLSLLCVLVSVGLMIACYPTTDDVNRMQESNQVFNAGLHDASNDLMTKQHQEMTPAVAEALALMNAQYLEVSAELKKVAGSVKAKGADVGGLMSGGIWEIVGLMFPGLAGIGLWIQNLLKPSRASGQVAALEAEAKVTAAELNALKLSLAKAADAGELLPIGGAA